MSCYGSGELVGDAGPEPCPDCAGTGFLPGPLVLTERRLRELEALAARGDATVADVRWLVFEVRRLRDALLQILSAAQDAPEDDALSKKIRFEANAGLGLYEAKPSASET